MKTDKNRSKRLLTVVAAFILALTVYGGLGFVSDLSASGLGFVSDLSASGLGSVSDLSAGDLQKALLQPAVANAYGKSSNAVDKKNRTSDDKTGKANRTDNLNMIDESGRNGAAVPDKRRGSGAVSQNGGSGSSGSGDSKDVNKAGGNNQVSDSAAAGNGKSGVSKKESATGDNSGEGASGKSAGEIILVINVEDYETLPAPIAEGQLNIERVEVLTSPEFQAIYRQSVYKGDAAKGEDPDKWYTTENTINLRDPRVFTLSFSVPESAVSAYLDKSNSKRAAGENSDKTNSKIAADKNSKKTKSEIAKGKNSNKTKSLDAGEEAARRAFLEGVKLKYGGYNLDAWGYNSKNSWGSGNDMRGLNPIFTINSKSITKNTDGGYNVYIELQTNNPWETKYPPEVNVPYKNYGGGAQLYQFSDGQSADNRWYWQIGPANEGLGEYEMTAVTGAEVDEKTVASRKMDIQQYDGSYSWIQMNEFAQSLIKAINESEYPKEEMANQVTGTIAKGYVEMNEDGEFVKGSEDTGVWVEVSILGYGLTDNEKEENRDYNNYARYNAIWNIVVAQDRSKVDKYLNETKPEMNSDPDKLISKYKDADPKDIDMLNVCYLNNVHPDEISGIDSEIKLITDLIAGGKAGNTIDYYKWEDEDMDFRYRDPAEGYEQSEDGHQVKGGYTGEKFKDKAARKIKKFNTKEALDNFIFVTNICSNPDAKAGMRRTNRYDIDLNRDGVFTTMPETIALIRDIMKWDPMLLLEWHGYVQEMLIEPCTAPHDPAYDYDLLANNMQNLTYAAGEAVTANTGYDTFLVPWDHYDAGDWDDGGTIYAPMFSELLGCFGYTIEFPDANSDSYDAGNVIIYSMIDELLHGTCEYYEGNRLNGQLKDKDGNMRDSHEGDFLDKTSMRKNSVLSKLETKKRGINNVDSMDADKYFIDKKLILDNDDAPIFKAEDVVVGRARPKDDEGKTLSFYPDYIVIPRGEGQYNFAEGIKGINQMISWGIHVEKTTEDVTYKGKKIEKGSYVLPMEQACRNVIFEVMSKGYDATSFADMYADIYCNLPDVRGFDSVQVYDKDLFDGKTEPQGVPIQKVADITGEEGDYVVFKSQSTDAVRFVNHLLKNNADVWMMTKTADGVGTASDYVIKKSDLDFLYSLDDKPALGIIGCQIEGHYTAELPEEAKELIDPVIQFNTERTAQSGGALWYLLDDYLGFNSMADYNGSSDELRSDANVILFSDMERVNDFQDSWAEAVKSGQAGLVMIGDTYGLDKLGVEKPTATPTFADVALNGTYNVDDSLYSANYANTSTYYARGYAYSDLPKGAKVLFRSLADGEDAFIGGFQATNGDKAIFGDKVTMFSKKLTGKDYARDNQVVVFGQVMEYRAHYQKLLPMLATAIYAGAAGIVDGDVQGDVPGGDSGDDPKVDPKAKKANPMTAKGKIVKIKYRKLKKKNQTIKRRKAITIKNRKGKLTFKKVSVTKIRTGKAAAKAKSKKNSNKAKAAGKAKTKQAAKKKKKKYPKKFIISKKTGNITVKKGVKRGTYRLKVRVTDAGNATYKSKTKTVIITIKVKNY